jgi:hypothetical protein
VFLSIRRNILRGFYFDADQQRDDIPESSVTGCFRAPIIHFEVRKEPVLLVQSVEKTPPEGSKPDAPREPNRDQGSD